MILICVEEAEKHVNVVLYQALDHLIICAKLGQLTQLDAGVTVFVEFHKKILLRDIVVKHVVTQLLHSLLNILWIGGKDGLAYTGIWATLGSLIFSIVYVNALTIDNHFGQVNRVVFFLFRL